MLIDLHCHTWLSKDNLCDPEALLRRARELGMEALCITEHHSVEASRELEPVAAKLGLRLLRACEASTELGHLLLFGVRDDAWNRYAGEYLRAADVIRAAREQGAAVVAAHPYRGGGRNKRFMGDRVRELDVDGIEVGNGKAKEEENAKALAVAVERGLAQTGGSDAHDPDELGTFVTEVDGEVRTIDDLVRAIRERRTKAARWKR